MAKAATHEGELARLGRELDKAQSRVDGVRARLDERLAYWHQRGVPIRQLALASGVSRETVYKAIKRYGA